MSLELALSPAGHLWVAEAPEVAPAIEERWAGRIRAAFEASSEEGLLHLGVDAMALPLPDSLSYWRDLAKAYLGRACQEAGDGGGPAPRVSPEDAWLEAFAAGAPPIRGAENISVTVLRSLWEALGSHLSNQTAASGLGTWLRQRGSAWHTVGRVTFHLAENRRDAGRPFAFLATYTRAISDRGKAQHLPLSRALQEFAGAKNRAALTALLSPVQRAAERSALARALIESRSIFQALTWSPPEAHRFLQDIPLFEESGLLVRVPDWWRAGRPSRPRVSVRIGDRRGGGLGLDQMLDFSVGVALDGKALSEEELAALMQSQAPLVLLKGQWVEIDKEKLAEVLEHWRRVERAGDGMSFLEGMRLLAGFGKGPDGAAEEEAPAREWSEFVPGDWLRETLAAMRDPTALAGFDAGRDLRTQLRDYQRTGAQWLWFMSRLGLGACLADDMGLGKTIQTLALLLQLKREAAASRADAPPSILVAPASLVANWRAEIERFAPGLDVFFAHPSESSPAAMKAVAEEPGQAFAGKDLVVTTYGMLARSPRLRAMAWRLAVLDEAQAIKNPAARQTRAVKELRARARIALTGTPVENRAGDLWSLFDFLCPGLLGNATEFARTVGRLSADPTRHFAPLRQLTRPYILRRLKTDKRIIADLPEKTEVDAWCLLCKAQAALYEQSVRELKDKLGASDGIARRGLVLAFLMRFKQICNHPSHWLGDGGFDPAASGKFGRLTEIAEEIAARQEKALVFTQFREMCDPLAAHLGRAFGRPGLVLHGGTPVRERARLVSRFGEEGGPPFFVLSLKAGGTGLNLTPAAHVIHFDRWWNPAVENQATDRAFRIGQRRNVMVHKFVCRGTVEERIRALIEEKRGLAEELLADGGAPLLTEMPDEELLRFVALDIRTAVGD
ncbi:MAG: DEAD/DEAH box helicase [Verrucomicrobiae bacterium]|nr:DEAD/DEAH box helicase [Verrucomicrobiae bacterium]